MRTIVSQRRFRVCAALPAVVTMALAGCPQADPELLSGSLLAERFDHHPDIDIRYKTVRILLTSHDSGGVTERDANLAKEIEAIA